MPHVPCPQDVDTVPLERGGIQYSFPKGTPKLSDSLQLFAMLLHGDSWVSGG